MTPINTCYIQVVPMPLVARVKGGSVRKVFKEHGIVLESRSYDPNAPRNQQDHLQIGWSCQIDNDPVCNTVWKGPHEIYKIDPEYLNYNTKYEFTLTATTDKYDNCAECSEVSPQYASVIVHVEKKIKITASQAEFSIECFRNCGEAVLADREVVLKMRFSHRVENAIYEWTFKKDSDDAKPVVGNLVTSINPKAIHILFVEENTLEEGAMYLITATGKWVANPDQSGLMGWTTSTTFIHPDFQI